MTDDEMRARLYQIELMLDAIGLDSCGARVWKDRKEAIKDAVTEEINAFRGVGGGNA